MRLFCWVGIKMGRFVDNKNFVGSGIEGFWRGVGILGRRLVEGEEMRYVEVGRYDLV